MYILKQYKFIFYRLLVGGSNNSLSKFVINEMSVSLFLFIRQTIILLFSFIKNPKEVFQFKNNIKNLTNKDKANSIMLGICKGLSVLSFYISLQLLPVSFVSIAESALSVIFSMLVAIFLLKEKFNINHYFYILLLLIGIFLTAQIDNLNISITAWIFLILNGLFIALDSYYNQKLTNKLKNNEILLVKNIAILPVAIISFFIFSNQWISLKEFISYFTLIYTICFFLSTFSSFLSTYLVIRSVESIGATKTIIISSTMPMVSVIIAIIAFKESFNIIQIIGFIFIMIGLFGFNRLKMKKKHVEVNLHAFFCYFNS